MERDLFRDRHPLAYASLHHSKELAIAAVILMVLLEIVTFARLIHLRLVRDSCSFGTSIRARR